MRRRTKARELALQLLYQADVMKMDVKELVEDFFSTEPGSQEDPAVRDFAVDLVKSVCDNLSFIDETISKYATNWQLDRMAIVDRNILRLAIFEILFSSNTPIKVAINEAVELAKSFGSDSSPRLINGVLGSIATEYGLKQSKKRG